MSPPDLTPSAATLSVLAAAASVLVLTGGQSGRSRLAALTAVRPPPPRSRTRAGSAAHMRASPRASARATGMSADASTRADQRYAGHNASTSRARAVAAGLGGLAVAVLIGGTAGVIGGVATAVAAYIAVGRLEPASVRRRRERVMRDLPGAASLLAAAVSAGATPVAGIEVVGTAVGGPLGDDLQRLAGSARLGGDLSAAATGIAADEAVTRLVRIIARAVDTGAPLAAALDRLASDLHAERRFEIDRRARSVGVRAAAPLGLCFLPAFLLIGVIPVVAGIASTVLDTVL